MASRIGKLNISISQQRDSSETSLVQAAVPDDVFIRAGKPIFKIIDNGTPLHSPVAYTDN